MNRNRKWYNGVLLFYKTPGCTSHDAVMSVRSIIKQRRIGHAGTLDPLAEGLLVVCVGKATKIVRFLVGCDKRYEAEICLGQTSRTYDGEGLYRDQMPKSAPALSDYDMTDLLSRFTGTFKQQVPAYSAVRVNGKRLYDAARKGEDIIPPVREVTIKELTLYEYEKPYLRVHVTCTSGTYIRSLAHDIGKKLGCGAYLSHLRRTAVGHLKVEDSMTLSQVEAYYQSDELDEKLLPYEHVLPYSAIKISDDFRPYVFSGKRVTGRDILGLEGAFTEGDRVLLKDSRGKVLAIGTAGIASTEVKADIPDELFNYTRVLN